MVWVIPGVFPHDCWLPDCDDRFCSVNAVRPIAKSNANQQAATTHGEPFNRPISKYCQRTFFYLRSGPFILPERSLHAERWDFITTASSNMRYTRPALRRRLASCKYRPGAVYGTEDDCRVKQNLPQLNKNQRFRIDCDGARQPFE